MRSHRIQKSAFKAGETYTFSDDFIFSKFEFYDIKAKENDTTNPFIPLPTYTKPDDDATEIYGKKEIEEFSEELKYQRRNHLKKLSSSNETSSFKVDLAYFKPEDNKYKCVTLVFNYKYGTRENSEKVTIEFETVNDETLQIKDLDLDSDITEYLFRFTRGLSWGSETHGILDCNPNESVNKGVYFTLNAPFNEVIDWDTQENKKRMPILAYRITQNQ